MKNAIILCSGGLDSVTTAFYAKKRLKYDRMKILFFDYGQRNLKAEKRCVKKHAKNLKADFIETKLHELRTISTSLLNSKKRYKKIGRKDLKDSKKESDKWYVPCRNLVFLSNTLALAESLQIKEKRKYDIFVGFKNEGEENYPDTSQIFLDLLNKISNKSTLGKFKIKAPFIKKDKEGIILLGEKFGIDFRETFSCYTSAGKHCGICLSCALRKEGFYWANVKDPTNYAN